MVLTVLAIVVAVLFVATGGVKLFGVTQSLAIRDSLDVPPGQWRMIGVLEWLGAAGLLVGLANEWVGRLAAIGLGALMVGAIVTRIRAARRHQRSEAAGLAMDGVTLALVIVTAVAFATSG
jgi:uncharacterized membrane protein YphA (DoxX/SURF4 family)